MLILIDKGGYLRVFKNITDESEPLLEENLKFYFSFYNYASEVDGMDANVFIYSNPNKTIVASGTNITTDPEDNLFELNEHSSENIIWFTFPFEVELKIKKRLPNIHSIFLNGEFNQIYENDSTLTGKEFLIKIHPNNRMFSSTTEFSVKPKNLNDLDVMKHYDVVNNSCLININYNIPYYHPINRDKDPIIDRDHDNEDDGDVTIIIIICVCCVVVVVVIVVVVVVVVKKRKKAKIDNVSANQNDE